MNSRDRVLDALEHKEPDRVPIDFCGTLASTITPKAYEALLKFLGLPKLEIPMSAEQRMYQLAPTDERLLKRFNVDVYNIIPSSPSSWSLSLEEKDDAIYFVDEWRIRHKVPKSGLHSYMIAHPLAGANVEDLEQFDWPDPRDPARFDGIEEKAKHLHESTEYALAVMGGACGILEVSWFLRGLNKFLTDLVINKKFAERLLDKVLEFHLDFWDEMLGRIGEYIQIVFLSDDLGTQTGPMMSPEMYRDLIKPAHKKLCSYVKSFKKDIYTILHSDGNIYPLIPDIIDTGIDALNPIQVSAKNMDDTEKLKREFGDKLTFWGGGCDTQKVLPFGTPTDVVNEVKRRIRDLAPGGGFVFTQVQVIQPKTPPENICAMFDTAVKYGKYPICTSP